MNGAPACFVPCIVPSMKCAVHGGGHLYDSEQKAGILAKFARDVDHGARELIGLSVLIARGGYLPKSLPGGGAVLV